MGMGQLRLYSRVAAISNARSEKRIYIHSSSRKPIKSRDIGQEGKLWREVWNISKPMIAAYFAKLLEENAKTPETRLRNESLK
jgi:hypothetical protein